MRERKQMWQKSESWGTYRKTIHFTIFTIFYGFEKFKNKQLRGREGSLKMVKVETLWFDLASGFRSL